MDTWQEIYILVSAIFIAGYFARRAPIWLKRIYWRTKLKTNYLAKAYENLYEIFTFGET